ncbi:MAG: nitroreductase family deazaflavin-dependent oxidoreductase [Actinomycetota bacterium]
MARKYEVTRFRRAVNSFTSAMARRGNGPASELTVLGRKSGEPRTVPVTPIDVDGSHYLVSPYGAVGWVHNLRAAGHGSLARGGTSKRITVEECAGEEAGIVLKPYYEDLERIVGPYFDLPEDPTVEDFTTIAENHPVFRYEETELPALKR